MKITSISAMPRFGAFALLAGVIAGCSSEPLGDGLDEELAPSPTDEQKPADEADGPPPAHTTTVKPTLRFFDPASAQAKYAKVLLEAQTQGASRVLVHLKTPFAPEGFLSRLDRDDQRFRIKDHQGRVLGALQARGGRNFRDVKQFRSTPLLALEADAATLEALRKLPEVAAISEDGWMYPSLAQTVPMIGADRVRNTGNAGQGEIIGILDTGFDGTHPDLAGKIIDEACFSQDLCNGGTREIGPGAATPCSFAGCEHGTMVAGVAAGYRGVAPGASIMAVKVVSSTMNCAPGVTPPCLGGARASNMIMGLEHIYYSKRRVAAINISFGDGAKNLDPCWHDIEGTAATLRSGGIATVISSGNSATKSGAFELGIASPGCTISGISVGSVSDGSGSAPPADQISDWSQSASFLSLLAPGDSIEVPIPGGGYVQANGTSLAAPHVAGAFALMRSRQQFRGVDAILTDLRQSGTVVGEYRAGPVLTPRLNVDLAAALTPNLALKRPVTSSGNTCAGWESPDMAVNDSGYDKWCAFGANQWLRVDLGSQRYVRSFTIRHAGAGGEDLSYNSKDFYIELSRDGSTWTKPVNVSGNTASVTSHELAQAELARYVRLTVANPGTNPLAAARIYEFQVFGDPSTNLARGKTATSSALCHPDFRPSNVLDGTIISDVMGAWCSADATPWLKVDLGATALIDRVTVKKAGVNRYEDPQTNLASYDVETSVDNSNWTTVARVRGATGPIDVLPLAPTSARYVRVSISDRGADPYARIYELEVYGMTGTNVARGKPASGTTNCSGAQTPAKAVDGSTNSLDAKWCSTLADKTKYSWKVDLGAANTLKWFTLRHAGVRESTALNTKNFTIQTSLDNNSWTTVVTQLNNTAKITTHAIKPVSARYVRVNITAPTSSADTRARLYEVEAYK